MAGVKPTAVRFSEFGCKMVFIDNHRYPLAGLDPATHVFFRGVLSGPGKDVDARDKPGHGDFFVGMPSA